MIWDWDLWPWRVAEGAGPTALAMMRLDRGVNRIMLTIGQALLPTLRQAQRAMADFAAALRDEVRA